MNRFRDLAAVAYGANGVLIHYTRTYTYISIHRINMNVHILPCKHAIAKKLLIKTSSGIFYAVKKRN